MFDQLTIYADAILMMACLGSALFCLQLQRRLKKLQKSDEGVGKAITEMTRATLSTRSALEELSAQVRKDVLDLDQRYDALKAKRQDIDDLLDAMEGQTSYQIRRCREAQQLTEKALTPLVQKAEIEIQALTQALDMATRVASLPLEEFSGRPAAPAQRTSEGDRRTSLAQEAGESRSNPFLRAVNG